MANYPLSPFRQVENTFYISGQIGIKDGKLVSENINEQTVQAIANIKDILEQNKMTLENIADVTAFITEQSDYTSFNDVYSKAFKEPFPSRTTVTVKSLPANAKVELKVIATK